MIKVITSPEDLKEQMKNNGFSVKQYLQVKTTANLFDVHTIKVKLKSKD